MNADAQAPTPAQLQRWQQFLLSVRMEKILLLQIAALRGPWRDKGKLTPEIKFAAQQVDADGQAFRALFRFEFSATAESEPEPVARVISEHLLFYASSLQLAAFTEEVARFAGENACFHAWPFARAEVARTLAEMEIPPYYLPALVVGPAAAPQVPAQPPLDLSESIRRIMPPKG